MLEWSVLLIGLALVVVQSARFAIEYLTYRKPEPKADGVPTVLIERKGSNDKAVDDWIVKEWAIEEWTKEMKKYPENSPKRKAYEDRLKSMGRYGDRHQAQAK